MFKRHRNQTPLYSVRLIVTRFYTTNRNSYFKLLKNRFRDAESNYIKSLKRNTTSMVSVIRNGNHLLNSSMNKKFGNTLWRYFNSPFNVVFMTTNIFAFAGIVAFSTLIDVRHLHHSNKIEDTQHHEIVSHDKYAIMNTGVIRRHLYPMVSTVSTHHIDVPELPVPLDYEAKIKNQNKTLEMLQEKITQRTQELEKIKIDKMEETITNVSSPLQTYTLDNINIEGKKTRIVEYNSSKIKASLFNMLYSFKIYEDMMKDDELQNKYSKSWYEELKIFKNKQLETDTKNDEKYIFKPTVTNFYDSWRSTYQTTLQKDNIQSIENFTLPNWSQFPGVLKDSCNALYENKMNNLDDFQQFYESIKSNKFKKLVRMWYYDNYQNLKTSQSTDTNVTCKKETFYNELLKDSVYDPPTFIKYASVVLNPYNSRNKILFNNIKTETDTENVTIPVVQMSTMLNILEGFLFLQNEKKQKGKILNYNDTYLRIIHMIKKNGYLRTQGDIGIQLCPDDQIIYKNSNWLSKDRQDPKLYDELGKDPRVLQLLSQISTPDN